MSLTAASCSPSASAAAPAGGWALHVSSDAPGLVALLRRLPGLRGHVEGHLKAAKLDEIARMDGVLGARVLVIGSASPWLEACFLYRRVKTSGN